MRRRGLSVWILVLVAMSSSGCALTEPLRPVTHYAKRLFTFRGTDYANPAEEEDDAWVKEAGEEAHEIRGGRPLERDPDQWYRKYFMSEKARSIERNVGFD